MREYFASKPGTGRGKGYSISHPIRDMYGFKLEGELNFDNLTSYLGAGYSEDVFKWRGAGTGGAGVTKAQMDAAVSKPHVKERKVTYKTIYTQNEYVLENNYGLFGGLRLDAGESIDLVFSVSKNSFRGLVTPQLLVKEIL